MDIYPTKKGKRGSSRIITLGSFYFPEFLNFEDFIRSLYCFDFLIFHTAAT